MKAASLQAWSDSHMHSFFIHTAVFKNTVIVNMLKHLKIPVFILSWKITSSDSGAVFAQDNRGWE